MVKLINLTPHPVTLSVTGPEPDYRLTIPPSGVVARVRETLVDAGWIVSVDESTNETVLVHVAERTLGDVEGLPECRLGYRYIVSALVAEAAWKAGRWDVYAPGDFERDAQGRIVAARKLLAGPRPTPPCSYCGYDEHCYEPGATCPQCGGF